MNMKQTTILSIALLASAAAGNRSAPNFRLFDANGAPVKLTDFRGKVVLLDFWATECGGCKTEIPWFTDFARDYKDKGLAVIGVSMDILYEDLKGPEEAWSRVKPFVASHQVNYSILMGDDRVTSGYGIRSLPLTLLIDRRGKVFSVHMTPPKGGKEEFRVEIESLLKER